MKKFTVLSEKGFQMTFNNGLTISVMFGGGNYCEHYNAEFKAKPTEFKHESKNAEIAIFDNRDTWFEFTHDMVLGYVDPDEVAAWIDRVCKAKSIETL